MLYRQNQIAGARRDVIGYDRHPKSSIGHREVDGRGGSAAACRADSSALEILARMGGVARIVLVCAHRRPPSAGSRCRSARNAVVMNDSSAPDPRDRPGCAACEAPLSLPVGL